MARSCSLILARMWGVIGRRTWRGMPFRTRHRAMPAWTRLSSGRVDCSRGSGSPSESCRFRTADRSIGGRARHRLNTPRSSIEGVLSQEVACQYYNGCKIAGTSSCLPCTTCGSVLVLPRNIAELPAPCPRYPVRLGFQQQVQ